ncbi:CoA transferase [Nocardioides immobilis]|uniref:CoA transferase n=1 Tax=Nocardioides immobilis TaxID=2049295 RepID=A0A417XT78_9ACTN|nr:CoA transferase [Nocardioides immobilis]RHW23678.1 CoA transferase [Nocardioides immobilis]
MKAANLADVRVVEYADEQAEYCGLVLAGLGAEVVKVEPPDGSPSRRIGPFLDEPDPERSLHFWNYNRGKRSVALELGSDSGAAALREMLANADVFLDSSLPAEQSERRRFGIDTETLARDFPRLIIARMTPFGEAGPWCDYKGSDLVHLALGGPVMNCGYSPQPDGTYDLPPVAPQLWHAYHIASEQLLISIMGALVYRQQSGVGQVVSCSVHEAVAKNTELDLMNWVMRHATLNRQTNFHAGERLTTGTNLLHTKDGRWFIIILIARDDRSNLIGFLEKYGMAADLVRSAETGKGQGRAIPGSEASTEDVNHLIEVTQRLFRRFTYETAPWQEAQAAGVVCVPLRKPEENLRDPHWVERQTFAEVEHPELDCSFTYVASKWLSTETSWEVGRRAPLLNEDAGAIEPFLEIRDVVPPVTSWHRGRSSVHGKPMALDGIRILDFTWFLASAGGTRFLSALGAECIKVEWAAAPDTRLGAMAPVGGRQARRKATGPLEGVTDSDMGGQFNNKNAGKRGMSLNVRHPDGLEIARKLVAISDIVAEGFSPGVMDRWGLGYNELRAIKPDIIYAQQSGMGTTGTYGRFRAVGPVAAALSGMSEMSGLPEPAMPAGWGYSYLDWIGAYSFSVAMMSAILHRDRTGRGQWIDASQTETGIFLAGVPILAHSAIGTSWERTGNRSPCKPAAPHGIYPCAGTDRWLAVSCFAEEDWKNLTAVAERPGWLADPRFATLEDRITHQEALDAALTSWTREHDRYELMRRLQAAGVAAGVCQTAEDRCDVDPQLADLNWLTEVTGTKIGTWPIAEVPGTMTKTPTHIGGAIDRGAPCYGEDNEWVLGELLGYSTSQIKRLQDEGVV